MKPEIKTIKVKPGELETLTALHEHAVSLAEKSFADHGSAPFLWLIRIESGVLAINTPWENVREKDQAVATIRQILRIFDATMYAFIAEAWITVVTDPDKYDAKVPPSRQPDREDVLMVQSFDRNDNHLYTRFGVFYPPGRQRARSLPWGKLRARDDWPQDAHSGATGRLSNVFKHTGDEAWDREVDRSFAEFVEMLHKARGGG